MALPIDPLREPVLDALSEGPVVITAPTGSGKSTAVPRWLGAQGRVVVVEPRRVACRGVAARVAELEGCSLGTDVGYVVRDDARAGPDTRIVFVTPGVALRWLQDGTLDHSHAVLLDEFHERSLDLDLLLALLLVRRTRLGVLSATLDGDRVADHVGGVHLRGEGRAFPVEVAYHPGRTVVPDVRGLEGRIAEALDLAADREGDILVFLPGKREIASVQAALRHRPEEVLPLHGGLTLKQQARAFRHQGRRRILLATNVAETSVTLPNIEVVIDSGLVRRTRYHRGRATLTLLPIARDSAEQRRGRAGRVRPGLCIRLWAERAPLDPGTPPEIHRESLVPLVLSAAACGHPDLDLPFLDAPREHAIDDARALLHGLGALDDAHRLTDRGRSLFALPVDAHLGRLLQEGRLRGTLQDCIDLVAALHTPRSLFRRTRPDDPDDDLREPGCDGLALIRAVRHGEPARHHIDRQALDDARATARRLRSVLDVPDASPGEVDRPALVQTVLQAWPGCVHVARRRRREVAWSAGSTEQRLGRDSAVNADEVDLIVALDEHTLGHGRDQDRIITAAMPVDKQVVVAAGLCTSRIGRARIEGERIVTDLELTLAGRVLATREQVPTGDLARQALVRLFLEGRWAPEARVEAQDRLDRQALHARIEGHDPPPTLEDWVDQRVAALGLTSGDELALLEGADLLPDPLPDPVREQLDKDWPRHLDLGDARYRLHWRPRRRTLILEKLSGRRREPPPLRHLPGPSSWRVILRDHRGDTLLRERR